MDRDRIRRGLLAPLLAALILLAVAAAAQADTITVNTTADAAPSPTECSGVTGDCSLRQAIDKANSGDTIQLGSAQYSVTLGSDIEIAKSLVLAGSGVANTMINGSQNTDVGAVAIHRILRIDAGVTVTIQDLTLIGGEDGADEVTNCGGPCRTVDENGGGALWNDGGTVVANRVAFTDNDGSGAGGAVSNTGGSLTMADVSFTNNQAAIGDALFTHSGTVSGDGVTFEDNTSGCCNTGTVYLFGGDVSFVNTTVVGGGGSASIGGGIHNEGAQLTLLNDTLSGNTRGSLQTDQGGASTSVENTIIGAGFSDGADGDCVAANRPDGAVNQLSTNAITNDLGNNIDEDGSCNLTNSSDFPNADPHLVPIADNGGPTRTQAVVFRSPALDDANTTDCPPTDQRGDTRPSTGCDIGAFEAVELGAPSAITEGAENITDSSADLPATIGLHGEAGGFHFLYGTSQDDLSNQTDEAAAGVIAAGTTRLESQTLSGLTPDTTYYYEAVADNATASTLASSVLSFTTQPGPPAFGDISIDSITDTTATIHFSINPQGSDTTYFVKYGTDTNYSGGQTATFDAGSAPGFVEQTVNLTGLDAGSTIHFDIVASNDVQQDVESGDNSFNTIQAITGVAGQSVTVTDGGDTDTCPTAADTTVDWGDGSSDTGAQIQCSDDGEDGTIFQLTDSHTYAAAGDYHITISYSDLDGETNEYAHISARQSPQPPPPTPPTTNPSPPTVRAAAARSVTVTGAGFEGAVTPNGLPTQAYFQYGLDPKYSGGGAIVYDHSTPAQSVGSDFASHAVGPVAISGLLPNAIYHVRLVATNSDGTTFGPDVAFTTAAAAAPGAPVVGKAFDITPVSGFVLIKINGKFVPLTGAEQIRSGSQIDARHGSLELITSTGQKGKTQHGIFGGAIFKLTQVPGGLVTLTLVEGAFKGAPSYALCKARAAADPTATIASSKTLQLLKASAHGKFRTKGRYSAATVRGTVWTVADRCDGTLTHVITDSVAVTDFVRHKTIILHAGQSYLAKARKHK